MPKKEKIDVLIRDVDRATWMQFRALCLQWQKPAVEVVRNLIANAVNHFTDDKEA